MKVRELTPFNHRLDNLQAAILRVKLRYLDQWIESRRKLSRTVQQIAGWDEHNGSCRTDRLPVCLPSLCDPLTES